MVAVDSVYLWNMLCSTLQSHLTASLPLIFLLPLDVQLWLVSSVPK